MVKNGKKEKKMKKVSSKEDDKLFFQILSHSVAFQVWIYESIFDIGLLYATVLNDLKPILLR